MSSDVAQDVIALWAGISGIAQLLLAAATFALAWVAYVAFVQETAEREAERKRDELREIVGSLIGHLEGYVAKLSQSTFVSIKRVPYLTQEIADIEASLGMARAYGQTDLVDTGSAYLQAARDWRMSIIRAKRLRTEDIEKVGRSEKYKNALSKSSSVYLDKVRPRRDEFFLACGKLLEISIPNNDESLGDQSSAENE